jgi:hypothetical protein
VGRIDEAFESHILTEKRKRDYERKKNSKRK